MQLPFKLKFQSLLWLCCLLSSQSLAAQDIIWAKNANQNKNANYTRVVGQNQFGVFVLKHKNRSLRKYFSIEQFDQRLQLKKSKVFKIPGSELQKVIVTQNQIHYLYKYYNKGKLSKLLINTIDSNLMEGSPKTLYEFGADAYDISDIQVDFDLLSDKLNVWFLKDSNQQTLVKYTLLQNTKQTIYGRALINKPFEQMYIGDSEIDSSGNLYAVLTQTVDAKSKSAADFKHFTVCINAKNSQIKLDTLTADECFISAYQLAYNSAIHCMHIGYLGGYSDEDDNQFYGIKTIDCKGFSILYESINPIDRKLVSQIMGTKYEKTGSNLNKFKIKKLIPKADMGCVLICERMFITTQSDVFYVNGVPQSTYARIFNNDEVLVFSMTDKGNEEWSNVIVKNQTSINDGGYYNGIVIMVNERDFHILYNDRISANSDIIQVSFQANGIYTKKIVLNNEQYYAMVIPSEYSQVSGNSMVLPINQNRDFTYIKLIY
ncbi:MAG: hypothetical protein RLZZ318_596 [Bacteroidota bacterium]